MWKVEFFCAVSSCVYYGRSRRKYIVVYRSSLNLGDYGFIWYAALCGCVLFGYLFDTAISYPAIVLKGACVLVPFEGKCSKMADYDP